MPKSNKENNTTSSGTRRPKKAPSRAVWCAADDAVLLENLIKEKENGNQTDNSSWKTVVWTTTEKALAGSEMHSGGAAKTGESCHNRWTAVCF